MAQARTITQEEIELLEETRKKLKGRVEYRRLESVLFRAKEGKSAKEIASILRIAPRTVEKHQARYFKEGLAAFEVKKPGPKAGIPRYTTLEDEKALFTELEEQAKQGEWLKATKIKSLYEKRVNRPLGKTTIYKIFARTGWSKKQPRPTHPKGSEEVRDEFKKIPRNSSKYC